MTLGRIGLTLQYSDLNQPQTIKAPTNVKPFSQFQAKLSSFVQALSGADGRRRHRQQRCAAPAGGTTTTGSASAGVSRYSQCIQTAGGDVAKMQKCASLLNSGG